MKIQISNVASLYMRIINSVVVVGFYYGFLSTFSSIGPSYLLLLQAHIKAIEEGEKESKKEVSAATGFLVGQLIIFVSIYYKPLHLALGRPHTKAFLVPFFLLLLYYGYNSENLSQPTGQTLMHNPSTQSIFLINLLFPLLNHFFFPSSRLARLVNIYTFRYNNKMLFVTSSFVGWLIGQILFMKWVRFVLVWLHKNYLVIAKRYIFSNEYLFYAFRFYQNVMFDLRMSMDRFSIILVFFTCLCTFGRMPLPLLTFQIKAETQAVEPNTQEAEEKKRIAEQYSEAISRFKKGLENTKQNRENLGFSTMKSPIHFDQKTYRFDKRSLSSYRLVYETEEREQQEPEKQEKRKKEKEPEGHIRDIPIRSKINYLREFDKVSVGLRTESNWWATNKDSYSTWILQKGKRTVWYKVSETHEEKKYILDYFFNDCVHFCYAIKGIFLKSIRKISELASAYYHDCVHFCYVTKGIFLKSIRKILKLASEFTEELGGVSILRLAEELTLDPSDLDYIKVEESGKEESGIDDDKYKLYKKIYIYLYEYEQFIFSITKRMGELTRRSSRR